MRPNSIYHIVLPHSTVQEETIHINGEEIANVIRIPHGQVIDDMEIGNIDMRSYNAKYGFNLSTNEICNFLSHKKAWSLFKESDTDWCLIIESCVFLNISAGQIEECIEQLPLDWDIFIPYDYTGSRL